VDFEADAQAYLYEIQMQLDPHKFVPCDPAGKFSDDCVVMFDDGSEAAESEEEKVPKQDKEMIDLGLVEDEPMSQMIGTQS
jgi:predicted DNA-binding WGR domain protein